MVNFEQNLGFATIDKRWENQDDIRENVFNEAQKTYSTTLELQDCFHKSTTYVFLKDQNSKNVHIFVIPNPRDPSAEGTGRKGTF